MDIVVQIHLAYKDSVHRDILEKVVTRLLETVYTGQEKTEDLEEVGFIEKDYNNDGVNVLWIRTGMDPMTKKQLEDALSRIFDQPFEISLGDTFSGDFNLNRMAEIEAAAKSWSSHVTFPAP